MRSLIVTSSFARFEGDPTAAHGTALYRLVAEMGREIEGTVITHAAPGAPSAEQLGGFKVKRVYPERPQGSLANAWYGRHAPRVARASLALRSAAREVAPFHDLAHAFWFFPGGWSIAALPMKRILTVPGGIETYPRYPVIGPMVRRVIRGMDACVGVDTTGAETLERLQAKRVKYIPSPVDMDGFPFAEPVGQPRFAFVGRLGVEKGVDVLLDALALVHRERPEVTVEIVGDGPEKESLVARARSLGVAEAVTFSGALPPAGVAQALAQAAALVLPSRREGLPSAALEALAVGRPVVASAVGGLPGLLEGGRGLVVPPGDPRALADALLACLGTGWTHHALREVAEGFAVQRAAEAYVSLYRSVINGKAAVSC